MNDKNYILLVAYFLFLSCQQKQSSAENDQTDLVNGSQMVNEENNDSKLDIDVNKKNLVLADGKVTMFDISEEQTLKKIPLDVFLENICFYPKSLEVSDTEKISLIRVIKSIFIIYNPLGESLEGDLPSSCDLIVFLKNNYPNLNHLIEKKLKLGKGSISIDALYIILIDNPVAG